MFLAFLFGAFGAIVAEVLNLKRWQQWNNMPEKRFLALLKSIEFWAITVFLILLGGSVGVFEVSKDDISNSIRAIAAINPRSTTGGSTGG
jgi:hypothetical protein